MDYEAPAAVLAALLLITCVRPEEPPSRYRGGEQAATAEERGDLCLDVGDVHVCWDGTSAGDDCADGICVGPRPLPGGPDPGPLGWRCWGQGAARRCAPRRANASEFTCGDKGCAQLHPRLPDDGEWSCAALAGAVVCTGGEPPAGVARGPRDPGWICGDRGGPSKIGGERVCVDLSPDFPDGMPAGWRCRYLDDGGLRRLCERHGEERRLAEACGGRTCVDGARCVGGRCVPERPSPSCWLDGDCGGGSCSFGTCREEGRR